MKNILLCAIILLLMLTSASADVFIKPWDKNVDTYGLMLTVLIPHDFQKSHSPLVVETLSQDEVDAAALSQQAGETFAHSIRGWCIPIDLYQLETKDKKIKYPVAIQPYIFIVIVDKEDYTGEQFAATFVHEYGHYVEDTQLTPSEHRKWTMLWRKECKSKTLCSDYAYTNEREGFADTFLYYCLNTKFKNIKSISQNDMDFFQNLQYKLGKKK